MRDRYDNRAIYEQKNKSLDLYQQWREQWGGGGKIKKKIKYE